MKKLTILAGAFLSLFYSALAQPAFVKAYKLKVRMNEMLFETYVSELGVMSKQSIGHSGNADTLKRGIFIRYHDDSVFKIDYANSRYFSSTLQEADSVMSVERSIAQQARSTIESVGKPLLYQPRQLTRKKSSKKFSNLQVSVRSYVSPTNRTWVLYYAKTSDLMRSLNPKKKKKPVAQNDLQALLFPDAENILVRAEVQFNGKKEVIMDLEEARQLDVPVSTFSVPEKFASAKMRMSTKLKVNNLPSGPGYKLDQPAVTHSQFIDVTMDHGIGPVIANPSLYVIYWGKQFNLVGSSGAVQSIAASMQDIVSKKYSDPLAFYGVNEGKVVQNVFVNDDPPSSAGGGGSGAVVGKFLIDQIFDKQLPKIWWSFGDDDPLYMVLVTEDQVDHGGWSGYHFVVPTFYDSFVPFPFNYLMHEELPYAFAKIPNNAMNLGLEDIIQRENICKTNSVPCQVIRSFDDGTMNISHEYVEVCTDPTPFFTWVDAGRGTEGEIADICETSPAPFRSSSRVGTTVVSTYWSVPANACVPGSQISMIIKEPLDNVQISWMAGGARPTLFALASDPIDGDLTDIRWTDETGSALGTGVNIQSKPLSLGNHTITARAFNRLVQVASAVTHINVVAKEPDPLILSPTSNGTYSANSLINFRGSAFDLQDGDLPDNNLSWSVDGQVIGIGKLLTARINKTGIVGVTLTATNSAGAKGSVAALIKLGPATSNPSIVILSPVDNTVFFKPDDIITFRAQALTSAGLPVNDKDIFWSDDLDGFLGKGSVLNHKLSGGPGGPIIHHVTAGIFQKTIGIKIKDVVIVIKGAVL